MESSLLLFFFFFFTFCKNVKGFHFIRDNSRHGFNRPTKNQEKIKTIRKTFSRQFEQIRDNSRQYRRPNPDSFCDFISFLIFHFKKIIHFIFHFTNPLFWVVRLVANAFQKIKSFKFEQWRIFQPC